MTVPMQVGARVVSPNHAAVMPQNLKESPHCKHRMAASEFLLAWVRMSIRFQQNVKHLQLGEQISQPRPARARDQ